MAGVTPQQLLANAQALELFMRVSPEATSFLDCFVAERNNGPQLVLRYDSFAPDDAAFDMANSCEGHLKLFFLLAESKLKRRIDHEPAAREDPEIEVPAELPDGTTVRRAKLPEQDHLELHVAISLDDPRLSDMLLDLTARLVNEQRRKDPAYTLAYGEEDDQALRDKLSVGFTRDVTADDMKAHLPDMLMLPAQLHQHNIQRGGQAGPAR